MSASDAIGGNCGMSLLPPPSNDGFNSWRSDYDRLPKDPPPPAPSSLDDATVIPLVTASIFSVLTYMWLNPLMVRLSPSWSTLLDSDNIIDSGISTYSPSD